ncbi:putative tubulin-tyrosine ligase family protein [Neospora caninum Liverpool]|uniref:Putative tubulin-tyrosine ligase family protein n=1 Tax=Neospora caninum (strain Liverpool) TaxID=572307 RepID=F0VPI1_NEOCL|nr:putative tubulin-tyrosine ligase family protein [Neospora caninum Liverpool]CBZ55627.1 putative tubulin-tyrosine ligase family protein [Neospora caninum Liverpool]CEL70369.1 TPA: tubulin-tyrosine ligase family protein, putative [Neospora caninum Liverpool]|eukprot:XP_003885655.1 putative tubulin-tyrosine ligase family protein [Neospora caninum Liverpool]
MSPASQRYFEDDSKLLSSTRTQDSSSSGCVSSDSQVDARYETFFCSASEVSTSIASSSCSLKSCTLGENVDGPKSETNVPAAVTRDYFSQFVNGIRTLFFDKCVAAGCSFSKAGGPASKVKGPSITLDLSQAGKEKPLMESCVRSLGWKKNSSLFPTGDIAWLGFALTDGEHRDYASIAHVVNRFPGLHEFAKKRWLARVVSSMTLFDPDGFSFFPRTWLLPEDREAVQTALRVPAADPRLSSGAKREPRGTAESSSCPRRGQRVKTITTHITASCKQETVYILKPDAGTQGAGLKLVSDLDQIPKEILEGQDGYIVQQYICNPYLLDNRKFDFRVYVLITAVTPKLSVFVSRRSLVRFCTEDYEPPCPGNMNNEFMHLTNYAINKDHRGFVRSSNVHDRTSSKRLLDDVFEDLLQQNVDVEYVWRQIVSMVEKVMTAFKPLLALKYDSIYRDTTPRSRCFQIVGLDILLDANCKAWLLEVNGNPSLRCDYEYETAAGFIATGESLLDRRIKEPLVSEALVIVYFSLLGAPSQVSSYLDEEKNASSYCGSSRIPRAKALQRPVWSHRGAQEMSTKHQQHIKRRPAPRAEQNCERAAVPAGTQSFSHGALSCEIISNVVPRTRMHHLIPDTVEEPLPFSSREARDMSIDNGRPIPNPGGRGVSTRLQPAAGNEDKGCVRTALPMTATTADTTSGLMNRTLAIWSQRRSPFPVPPCSDTCSAYAHTCSLESGTFRSDGSASPMAKLSQLKAPTAVSVNVSAGFALGILGKQPTSTMFGNRSENAGYKGNSVHGTMELPGAQVRNRKNADRKTNASFLEISEGTSRSCSGSTASGCTASDVENGQLSLRTTRQRVPRAREFDSGDCPTANNEIDAIMPQHCCLWIPVESALSKSPELPSPTSLLDMCQNLFLHVTQFPDSLTLQLRHWLDLISRTHLQDAMQHLWVPVSLASRNSQHFSGRNPAQSPRRTCRRFARRPLSKRDLIFLYMQRLKVSAASAGGYPEAQGLCFWSFWELMCLLSTLTRLLLGTGNRSVASKSFITKATCADSGIPTSQVRVTEACQGCVLGLSARQDSANVTDSACTSGTPLGDYSIPERVSETLASCPRGRSLSGDGHGAVESTFSNNAHTASLEESCSPSSPTIFYQDFSTAARESPVFVPWWPHLHNAFNSLGPCERTAGVSSLLRILLVGFHRV